MSKAVQINGVTFPGEVKPPKDGDVKIVWKTRKHVEIYIVLRPFDVPLQISVSLLLDQTVEASA